MVTTLSADDTVPEALIWKNLNYYCYDNAIFLAEHLYSYEKSESSVFLLATCYYRNGHPNQAKKLLQCSSLTQPLTKYLYAQCCLETGDLCGAEDALLGSRIGSCASDSRLYGHSDEIGRVCHEYEEHASFALKLLGDVYRRTDRAEKAAECYRRAFGLNNSLWSCYESLCSLGEGPDPSSFFPEASLSGGGADSRQSLSRSVSGAKDSDSSGLQSSAAASTGDNLLLSNASSLDASAGGQQQQQQQQQVPPLSRKPKCVRRTGRGLLQAVSETPGLVSSPRLSFDSVGQQNVRPTARFTLSPWGSEATPGSIAGRSHRANGILRSEQNLPEQQQPPQSQQQQQQQQQPPPTASLRNLDNRASMSPLGAKENNQGVRTRAQTRSLTSSRGSYNARRNRSRNKEAEDETPEKKEQQQQAAQDASGAEASDRWLTRLLHRLACAYRQLSTCQWPEVIKTLESLPTKQFYSGPVLHWISRAHYETEDYATACKYFAELRQRQPWNLRGMDLYSTALWYQHKDVALSALSRELLELDRRTAVEPWCAAGNCFSLQKEHEVALKYFRRATQINPHHAYAFVLLAHEYTAIDQLDKALSAFRTAVRLEPRAYNAWYGISNVYFKQEKFALAECHFHKALKIYPNSAVLLTNHGVTKSRMGRLQEALDLLTRARTLAPRMPLCRYQRASVLYSLERYKEALEELNCLRQLSPKESRVFFLLGRVYKEMNEDHQAMIYFSWAMDLDPRGANLQLKDTLDVLGGAADAGASSSEVTMDESEGVQMPAANYLVDMFSDHSDQSDNEPMHEEDSGSD